VKGFVLLRPGDLQEALTMLEAYQDKGIAVLAGGTDLVPSMRAGGLSPAYLLDISGLGLEAIEQCGNMLGIGAACTFKRIYGDPLCKRNYPDLCKAARSVGAVQTRGLATIGGNLCAAVPSLDSAPPLLVRDALFVLTSRGGERHVRAGQFFTGPRRTAMRPGEMLTKVLLPSAPEGFRADFIKFGRRNALSLAIANAAAGFILDRSRMYRARIAIGACAPTPVRACRAEEYLEGRRADEIDDDELHARIRESIRPISDARASAEYRDELAFALVRKLIRSTTSEVIA